MCRLYVLHVTLCILTPSHHNRRHLPRSADVVFGREHFRCSAGEYLLDLAGWTYAPPSETRRSRRTLAGHLRSFWMPAGVAEGHLRHPVIPCTRAI